MLVELDVHALAGTRGRRARPGLSGCSFRSVRRQVPSDPMGRIS